MKCPVCGEDVWVSKSKLVELCRNYYKRSMRCSNCADGKTLTVYRCYPISDKEMAEEYANLVSPPVVYHNPSAAPNGVGKEIQL